MQTVLFVKLQSQTQAIGTTSNYIQDMRMIALLHQGGLPPLIIGKIKIIRTPVLVIILNFLTLTCPSPK
jgi:hypothetical protein